MVRRAGAEGDLGRRGDSPDAGRPLLEDVDGEAWVTVAKVGAGRLRRVQLEAQAVRVVELLLHAVLPGHAERDHLQRAAAEPPARGLGPLEEGQERPRRTALVSEVEVMPAGSSKLTVFLTRRKPSSSR